MKLRDYVDVSKVEQIVTGMVAAIENEIVANGQKLPTINEISKNKSVARDTIEKAHKQLRKLGYVVSYP